jgi:hypothetical protein
MRPGLPDGIISNQKSQFGYILEDIAMENVCIFYGLLVNFPDIWQTFGHLVYFFPIWYVLPKKSGKPG